MKLIRKLFGTNFPDPEVGQIWRCTRNDELIRVTDVRIHTSGTIFVTCAGWHDGKRSWGSPGWDTGDIYAIGLRNWRRRLRDERRELVKQGATA